MLSGFISSLPLFYPAYLTGLLAGILLSLHGVFLIARAQIFSGLAVAQATVLGACAAALITGRTEIAEGALQGGVQRVSAAVLGASSLAAVAHLSARAKGEDAVGWLYFFCASAALILASATPLGTDVLSSVVSSSMLGGTLQDSAVLLLLLLACLLPGARNQRKLQLLLLDEELARAQGLAVNRWLAILNGATGAILGISIAMCGLLFCAGSMVLPVLTAKALCSETRQLWLAAPIVFVVYALPSYMIAHHYDLPPGPTIVLMGAMTVAAAVLCRVAVRISGRASR